MIQNPPKLQVLVFIVLNMPRLVLGLNEVNRFFSWYGGDLLASPSVFMNVFQNFEGTCSWNASLMDYIWKTAKNLLWLQVLHMPALEKCFKADYHYHQGWRKTFTIKVGEKRHQHIYWKTNLGEYVKEGLTTNFNKTPA